MADESQDKLVARLQIDVSGMLQQLQSVSDEVAKLKSSMSRSSGSDTWIQQANGATTTLRQSIKELQLQFKEGALSAQQLFDKLTQLRSTFASAGAFGKDNPLGIINDQAIRTALVSAEAQVNQFEDFVMNADNRMAQNAVNAWVERERKHVQSIEAEKVAEQQAIDEFNRMYQQDVSNYVKSVDAKVTQAKFMYDMQIQSAQDTYDQLLTIYENDAERFDADVNKKMQMIRTLDQLQTDMARQQATSQAEANTMSSADSSASRSFHPTNITGWGMNPIDMAGFTISFAATASVLENLRSGLVDVGKDAAGLQQVFHGNIQTQQQLNDATNQFIGVAEKYGASITDVLQAARLWGRQYDETITKVLTDNSTMLSMVDNLNVSDANKAVESSMQALGMQVNNASQAFASSMALIDSWTAVSHSLSVSTSDITSGFERMSASGHQVNLNISQMTALIAAGVRNSGRTGKRQLAPYAA